MKIYTYQSYFFVPLPPPSAQTADLAWYEYGGRVDYQSKNTSARCEGITGRTQFRAFSLQQFGFENQPPQPPHPRREKAGSVQRGDDGTQAVFVFFRPPDVSWEVQPPPPPNPARGPKRGEAITGVSEFAFSQLEKFGWVIQSWQPPHLRRERAAALVEGDDASGTDAPFQMFRDYGFHVQPPQPPHPRREKAAALIEGDDATGTDAPFQVFYNYGFHVQPWQPPHRRSEKFGSITDWEDGNEDSFRPFFNYGFHVQPPQPPHPRPERAGGIQIGEDGIQFPLVQAFTPNQGFVEPPVITRKYWRQPFPGIDGIESPFAQFFDHGFHVQPPQPPHPKPEKSGSLARGIDGTDYPFQQFVNQGWPVQPWQPPRRRWEKWAAFARGEDGTPSLSLLQYGWPIQAWQPPYLKLQRGTALLRGIDGTDNTFAQFFDYGFHIQPPQPPHPKPERAGGVMRGDDGTEFPFAPAVVLVWGHVEPPVITRKYWRQPFPGVDAIEYPFQLFTDHGFPVQPWQPPHPKPERAGSLMRGEDGTESPFLQFFNHGFHIQPWQPPHPRPERNASIMRGDDGTEFPFIPAVTLVWGHVEPPVITRKYWRQPFPGIDAIEYPFQLFTDHGFHIQPWQPPRRRHERAGALARGEDGTPSLSLFPYGWHVQPWQPPYLRPRRGTALLRGIDGTEYTFQLFADYGFHVQPWQPPHPRPEKTAALLRGIDGTDYPFLQFFDYGFPIQFPQPPHPRPERSGAIQRGDDGNLNIFTFLAVVAYNIDETTFMIRRPRSEKAGALVHGEDGTPLFNLFPYEHIVQPWQSLHRRTEKFGALVRGEDGTPLFNLFPYENIVQPWQPPHPRREKIGSLLRGIDGTEFPFVPPFVLPWYETQFLAYRRPHYYSMTGEDGVQYPFQQFFNYGWPVQPWQPPHRAPERKFGSLALGEGGIEAQLIRFNNFGWVIQPWQPPHTTFNRAGAIMFGNPGIDEIFTGTPPVISAELHNLPWFVTFGRFKSF